MTVPARMSVVTLGYRDLATMRSFYERLGWGTHAGDLLVRQYGQAMRFTFNLPMTHPVGTPGPTGGVIDLMGPPW